MGIRLDDSKRARYHCLSQAKMGIEPVVIEEVKADFEKNDVRLQEPYMSFESYSKSGQLSFDL
jgi:hypothetical protein